MDEKCRGLQWETYSNSGPFCNFNDRCVKEGMGSCAEWDNNVRPLVSSGSTAHQHFGTSSGIFALLALGHSIHNQHIHVQIDNKSAVAYINHMGGTHSNAMDAIAKKIWSWALMRNNHISSVHIPGMENQQIFRQFTRIRFPPQVDLFASRLNYQLEKYVG